MCSIVAVCVASSMLRLSVFAAFAVLAVGSVAAQSSPQVTIDTGVVQGDIYTAAGGVNVEVRSRATRTRLRRIVAR